MKRYLGLAAVAMAAILSTAVTADAAVYIDAVMGRQPDRGR